MLEARNANQATITQDANEAENLKRLLLDEGKTFTFRRSPAGSAVFCARVFQAYAIKSAVDRMGIEINLSLPVEVLAEILLQHGVRLENRTFYRGAEAWRNGFYVIKDNEIAYFISKIVLTDPNVAMVCTNVKDLAAKARYNPAGGGSLPPTKKLKVTGV